MLSPNSTWIVHSRHDMTRHVRRVERVETSVSSRAVQQARRSQNAWLNTSNVSSLSCRAVLFEKLNTANMHGLDMSNVLCPVETWRAKWNWALGTTTLGIRNHFTWKDEKSNGTISIQWFYHCRRRQCTCS